MKNSKDWQRTTLGKALPLRYGKARTEKVGVVRESSPVYGSSGIIDRFDRALTNGPTLIVGRKGTVGATHYSEEPCWPIDTVYFAETSEGKDLRFFKYLIDHLQLGKLDRSTAVPGLSRDDYNAKEIAIPEFDEQQRIVAEIEKQFTRLDAGVTSLKRVQTALKRYRASLLKAACEGRLVPTEAELARKKNRSYETGEQLLQRILKERREKWSGTGKYKEPPAAKLFDLPQLREGWIWATVSQLSAIIVDCPHSTAKFVADGLPCVDTTCIKPGRIVREKLRYVSPQTFKERVQRLIPESGDIIFAREGTVGTAATVPLDFHPCLGQRVMLMRSDRCIIPAYFEHCLNSSVVRRQYLPKIVGSTAPHLNVAELKTLAVPLPPLAEQYRIVEEIESRLSVIEELEAVVLTELRRATRLRQSILQKAFSGKLATTNDSLE